MSHFKVMVIGADPEAQLEPFDENLEVERYVRATREELIAEQKRRIEKINDLYYKEYLQDKEKYREESNNKEHVEFLENEFPAMLEWSDEQIYEHAIKWVDADNVTPEGGEYSTYNPMSKYDWYQIGGRWAGSLKLRDGVKPILPDESSYGGWTDKDEETVTAENRVDMAYKKDIENLDEIMCFAVLKDGEWHEKGRMGWFAIVSDEKEDWEKHFRELLKDVGDDELITIVDCHL